MDGVNTLIYLMNMSWKSTKWRLCLANTYLSETTRMKYIPETLLSYFL
jgi:hypothetical protein